jgi:hypothetical protein
LTNRRLEEPFKKAIKTSRRAKTLVKWKLKKRGYRSVSFEGKRGGEPKGIVDLVAIRKIPIKSYDKMEILLLQVKGSKIRTPTILMEERIRLLKAAKNCEIIPVIAVYKQGELPKLKFLKHQRKQTRLKI